MSPTIPGLKAVAKSVYPDAPPSFAVPASKRAKPAGAAAVAVGEEPMAPRPGGAATSSDDAFGSASAGAPPEIDQGAHKYFDVVTEVLQDHETLL